MAMMIDIVVEVNYILERQRLSTIVPLLLHLFYSHC